MVSIFMCQKLDILKYIIPELEENYSSLEQNQAHSYTVFCFINRSLQCAADKSILSSASGSPASWYRWSRNLGVFRKRGLYVYGHEVI